jgi:Uma2 family endonuclease
MSTPPRAVPSFEELYRQIEALPQGVTGQILKPGALTTMSRPGAAHERAQRLATDWLRDFDAERGGKGWWIRVEYELRFPGDLLLVPDLSGWHVERCPTLPRENPLRVLPDWVCEILSSSTKATDRVEKLPIYARVGIPWVWLIDPEARTLEVYETAHERPVLFAAFANDARPVVPPFEAEVPLADWWLPS